MIRAAGAFSALAVTAVLVGCGGSGGTTTVTATNPTTTTPPASTTTTTAPTTETAPPTTETTAPTTSSSGASIPDPRTERDNIAACLASHGVSASKKTTAGHPSVYGVLNSGNVLGFLTYGSQGGAKAVESSFEKKFDAYNSPNDSVLIFYTKKASKADFSIGNACQKAAYNG